MSMTTTTTTKKPTTTRPAIRATTTPHRQQRWIKEPVAIRTLDGGKFIISMWTSADPVTHDQSASRPDAIPFDVAQLATQQSAGHHLDAATDAGPSSPSLCRPQMLTKLAAADEIVSHCASTTAPTSSASSNHPGIRRQLPAPAAAAAAPVIMEQNVSSTTSTTTPTTHEPCSSTTTTSAAGVCFSGMQRLFYVPAVMTEQQRRTAVGTLVVATYRHDQLVAAEYNAIHAVRQRQANDADECMLMMEVQDEHMEQEVVDTKAGILLADVEQPTTTVSSASPQRTLAAVQRHFVVNSTKEEEMNQINPLATSTTANDADIAMIARPNQLPPPENRIKSYRKYLNMFIIRTLVN